MVVDYNKFNPGRLVGPTTTSGWSLTTTSSTQVCWWDLEQPVDGRRLQQVQPRYVGGYTTNDGCFFLMINIYKL